MLLHVKGANYPQAGVRHEYHLSDGSTVIERPSLPVTSRWLYYNNLNHRVFNKSTQKTMRDAVERHKKRFNCK
ncbi:hypothetical protein [Citrobacter braakii]|uniref:hypothetical protein n=1 Tax=Citrobacter braakii TaxID=57706 RepID=UPI00403935C2